MWVQPEVVPGLSTNTNSGSPKTQDHNKTDTNSSRTMSGVGGPRGPSHPPFALYNPRHLCNGICRVNDSGGGELTLRRVARWQLYVPNGVRMATEHNYQTEEKKRRGKYATMIAR